MLINLTLRQMQIFVAVARNESYIKAARAIGLSQPAITANVRQLEDMLGVRLLDRTTRSVRLTTAGRDFLSVAERLLGDLSTAVDDIRSVGERRRGRVVVACLPSIAIRLVGPLMPRFTARYPGIVVKLYDGDASSVARRVRAQEADFGLGGYVGDEPEVDFVPLLRDRCCVICPKNHPLARRKSLRLKELEKHPFVVLGPATGTRQVLDRAAAKADVHLDIICETGQFSTVIGLVKAGIGVSVMPEVCLAALAPQVGLVARPLIDPVVERDIGLVVLRGRSLSPAAESFRDAVIDYLPSRWKDFATTYYIDAAAG